MFEMDRKNEGKFKELIQKNKVYKSGVYDFTFENRFIIYHAPMCSRLDYFAIDMLTDKSSLVASVNPGNEFNKATYNSLIPHILNSIKYTGSRRHISVVKNVDPRELIDIIFKVILPRYGYNIRKEQINLSKQIYEGLVHKQVTICEAEVGTGKTLAYLVAAFAAKQHQASTLSFDEPITITTSSIELQTSLVEKEIPNLSKMLLDSKLTKEPLSVMLRKGKEHYVCRFRCENYIRNLKQDAIGNSETIKKLEKMLADERDFDIDKLDINGTVKSRICVQGDSCRSCSMKDNCRYRAYVQEAMDVLKRLDFQVTNHNLYLTYRNSRSSEFPPILRHSQYVIIDEAHKMREAAQDTFGARLSETDVEKYVTGVRFICANPQERKRYKNYVNELERISGMLFDSVKENTFKSDDETDAHLVPLKVSQISMLSTMVKILNNIENMRRQKNEHIAVSCRVLIDSIKTIKSSRKSITWIEVDENNVMTLCSSPRNVDDILERKVWNKDVSHVLTSGTISDGKNFEYFKKENGIDRITRQKVLETTTESPFDYLNHARLYLPLDMPTPDNKDENYIKAVADRCQEIIKATNGHTAILFTSYKVLKVVYEQLEGKLDEYNVFCMSRGNKTVINDFKKAKNGILFASGSMWEGVDCVGDCLSSVIIVRLPFPIRSIVLEERKNECKDTKEFIENFCIPNMLIKLRQGVGRLIRCETDTGLISILDPRATGMAYSEYVDEVMKKYQKIYSIEEIENFFKKVKSKEYFNN